MFNLDLIEQDWKNNSFRLSEEEIIEIFQSEDATLSKYDEEWCEYKKKINAGRPDFSAEERLLRAIFGEDLEEIEQRNKLIAETPKPHKKHLSKENQRKVIEGSLYLVFDETRWWFSFFEEKLSMEKIYYICLEALMNCTKYMLHCEKPVFGLYVSKSIESNIIKHLARYMHITYREVYEMIHYIYDVFEPSLFSKELDKYAKFLLDCEGNEEIEKPSKIYYRLKDETYDESYIENISSDEFMFDYKKALENLDDTAKTVMELSFDISGYRGLTSTEIADYLGIDVKKVSNIRKKAIKTLRKDAKLNSYLC